MHVLFHEGGHICKVKSLLDKSLFVKGSVYVKFNNRRTERRVKNTVRGLEHENSQKFLRIKLNTNMCASFCYSQ